MTSIGREAWPRCACCWRACSGPLRRPQPRLGVLLQRLRSGCPKRSPSARAAAGPGHAMVPVSAAVVRQIIARRPVEPAGAMHARRGGEVRPPLGRGVEHRVLRGHLRRWLEPLPPRRGRLGVHRRRRVARQPVGQVPRPAARGPLASDPRPQDRRLLHPVMRHPAVLPGFDGEYGAVWIFRGGRSPSAHELRVIASSTSHQADRVPCGDAGQDRNADDHVVHDLAGLGLGQVGHLQVLRGHVTTGTCLAAVARPGAGDSPGVTGQSGQGREQGVRPPGGPRPSATRPGSALAAGPHSCSSHAPDESGIGSGRTTSTSRSLSGPASPRAAEPVRTPAVRHARAARPKAGRVDVTTVTSRSVAIGCAGWLRRG